MGDYADRKNRFSNSVKVEWLEGHPRNMQLLESVTFLDRKGRLWKAHAGAIINGASIPRILWIFGSPFVGSYRRASVIHDVYCDMRSTDCCAVHEMFYDAMIEDLTPKWKAKIMHQAVKMFGPKW